MTLQPLQNFQYFYDGQMRRFLEQVVRAFSGWGYMPGSIAGSTPTLQIVPCRMASTNSVVANIMRNQSSNTLLTTPMITVWQTGLKFRPDALQNRNFVDTIQVVERDIDPDTRAYTSTRGQGYTVRRLMPIPFEMEIQVDLWTTNLDQKYQLMEQMLITMCPSFDIQNSDNALDWTALTTMYFEDINMSSRSMPIGTSDEIDITTFRLRLPMWLSPPAKITQQTLIEQIITNINYDGVLPTTEGIIEDGTDVIGNTNATQLIITPDDLAISIDGANVALIASNGVTTWDEVIDLYGTFRPSTSMLAVITQNGQKIAGTLQQTQVANTIVWQIDPATLPSNTLPTVNAVIDPMRSYPVSGGLPTPTVGQRYIILNDIGPSVVWGNITAHTNDIIQYTNTGWQVSFSAHNSPEEYVLNAYSHNQLFYTGTEWVSAIDGIYGPGYWRLWL